MGDRSTEWLENDDGFIEAEHWESLYKWQEEEGDMKTYDCYISLNEWKDVLLPMIPSKKSSILMVGCGHAPFSSEMSKLGFSEILNMDFSETVIRQQKRSYPKQQWEVGDVRKMKYRDGAFDVILDKACADSLLETRAKERELGEMFREVRRVLRADGSFVVLTKWFDSKDGTSRQHGEGPPTLLKYMRASLLSPTTEEEEDAHGTLSFTNLYVDRSYRKDGKERYATIRYVKKHHLRAA